MHRMCWTAVPLPIAVLFARTHSYSLPAAPPTTPQGKEDCMRKAMKGVDITLDLARLCPALSLQQIYKLTEHQHDDWIAGGCCRGGGEEGTTCGDG